jgi:hypothetical protein
MLDFTVRISQKQVIYDSEIGLKNKKIKGIINWFQSITRTYNQNGEVCLEFLFSEKLKPLLLQLKEYTQLYYKEALPLGSGYSIRLYNVFRVYRDKMQKHQKRSKLKYELEELKRILGIEDKYKDWRKFNRVLQKVLEELNGLTRMTVKMELIREGRKVVALEFEFWDKSKKSTVQSLKGEGSGERIDVDQLTFAQNRAFENLVKYGVNDGIALGLVSKGLGSEISGFEDWYFEECIKIVELKSTAQIEGVKPGIFVNWFLKLKVFEQGDHFAKIMETLAARKKGLEKSNVQAWENRLVARGMTHWEHSKKITYKTLDKNCFYPLPFYRHKIE